MCIPTKLQQNIIDRTREGDTIAAFLVSTMQGETPGVKVNHRMDAAKQLIKYGFPDTQCDNDPLSLKMRARVPFKVPSPLEIGLEPALSLPKG